ncbi:nitrite/sulfite reductase [Acidaminococcus timonensis]|uniref:nitrite/sulfite reductase n=1 Tax=Acidaminococcus timonensis TaxID=1871002 RepID=UPI0008D96076|nr:nitrite/sulfite reductase [Acidaminococcus timonensis]
MTQITEKTKETIREQFPVFQEAARAFYAKELPPAKYKGTSGKFGSYGERGAGTSMLRLRFPAGAIDTDHMRFLARVIRQYQVQLAHFTTGEALQLHHLDEKTVLALYQECFEAGIYCYGAGGDNPRNMTASPLHGVEKGEPFDMTPAIKAAANFLTNLIPDLKLPRKYKVSFSNGIDNEGHATFKDLGFVARTDGTFDVYAGGGFGVNGSRFGLKIKEQVPAEALSWYIEGYARDVYMKYGDYQHRGTARSRFIRDRLGDEQFRREVLAAAERAQASGVPALELEPEPALEKRGKDDRVLENPRIHGQKQEGLYYVEYKPVGGVPDMAVFRKLLDTAGSLEGAELRLNADETCYIINLTAEEARTIATLTDSDTAHTDFEHSVSCIGAAVCQQGLCDSHGTLARLVRVLRESGEDTHYLPKCHFSGCPSTCTVQSVAPLGFRGAFTLVNGERASAFQVYADGSYAYGKERISEPLALIPTARLPRFFLALNETLLKAREPFTSWYPEHKDQFLALAREFA